MERLRSDACGRTAYTEYMQQAKASWAPNLCLCCRLQTASEGTLEEAEGVYVSSDGPEEMMRPASLERFTALRSLWLRQVNIETLDSGRLCMPPSLRCRGMSTSGDLTLLHPINTRGREACVHDKHPVLLLCCKPNVIHTIMRV